MRLYIYIYLHIRDTSTPTMGATRNSGKSHFYARSLLCCLAANGKRRNWRNEILGYTEIQRAGRGQAKYGAAG